MTHKRSVRREQHAKQSRFEQSRSLKVSQEKRRENRAKDREWLEARKNKTLTEHRRKERQSRTSKKSDGLEREK